MIKQQRSIPLKSLCKKNTDYDVELDYYSNINSANCILQWSATDICKQDIPTSQLFYVPVTCSSNGIGLNAAFFSGSTAENDFPATATTTSIEPTINFDWKTGAPPNISTNNFKARFTGYVQTLEAGLYTFYIKADDGVRMWVNDSLVVDRWTDGSLESKAIVALKGCRKYAIRIEYYERAVNASCQLSWSGPLFSKVIIPTTQLFTQPDLIINNWLGITPDWNTVSNWSKGAVPDADTDAVISVGVPYMPVVTGTNNTARSLKLNQGATIEVTPGAVLKILKH